MIIRIDEVARGFAFVTSTDEHGPTRRYYVAQQHTGKRMIIVCRNGLDLHSLIGQAVDVRLGWDQGTLGFVHEGNVGQKHSKLTVFRASHSRPKRGLWDILRGAPNIKNGGEKG